MTSTQFLPPFKAYHSDRDRMIIVTANKIASTFLDNFLISEKKFKGYSIFNDSYNELIMSCTTKIFLFREPIDRFFGWYNTFVHTPWERSIYKEGLYLNLLREATIKIDWNNSLLVNVYNFINSYSISEIRELLYPDIHTTSLYTFFKYTGLPLDTFNFYHMNDIGPLFKQKFGTCQKQYPNLSLTISDENLKILVELNEIFHKIYEEDYTILKPLVKPYEQ